MSRCLNQIYNLFKYGDISGVSGVISGGNDDSDVYGNKGTATL